VRRLAIFVAIALAAIGIALAVTPFHLSSTFSGADASATSGYVAVGSVDCPAPIVSAFRTDRLGGGWYGYAPLTNTPIVNSVHIPSCRSGGQRRLQYAGMFILAAAVLAIALRRNPSQPPTPETVPNDPM
jgi:hypothetical protein